MLGNFMLVVRAVDPMAELVSTYFSFAMLEVKWTLDSRDRRTPAKVATCGAS
jgi:hypothetical protein